MSGGAWCGPQEAGSQEGSGGGRRERVGWPGGDGMKLGFQTSNIYLVGCDPNCQVTKTGLRIRIGYFITH